MQTSYHNKTINSITQARIDAGFIAKNLGGRRSGVGYVAPCPAHHDARPSLSIRDTRDGRVLVHCFAGCEQRDVISALRALGLWPGGNAGRAPIIATSPGPDKRRFAALKRVWDESRQIVRGDPADTYLRRRGINMDSYPTVLRLNPALTYWHEGACLGKFLAIVARVENKDGQIACIHRTYLTPRGDKAEVPAAKKLMPPPEPGGTRGAAVRLYEPDKTLALAEGIETALAVHLQTGLPCWATVSAGGMKSVEIPESTALVVICADNDPNRTGELAAMALARRLLSEGRRCKLVMPRCIGTDWADALEGSYGS